MNRVRWVDWNMGLRKPLLAVSFGARMSVREMTCLA